MDLLQATFTAYNTMRVEKKYTIYEIEVRSASTVSWIVYKRYSDFFVVHNELLKNLPKSLQLPVVPAKRFAYSLASEFVERRKQELQTYLTELLRIPQVARSEVILRFLEVPDSVRPLITRVPIANDQEKDNIESASSPKKNFNKDERKIYDLVQQLDTSLSSKVVAIRSFEKFFFEQKPKISNELIQALFFGIDGYVGLIESCGNFDYSNVAAKASLELLNRLLSIERNRGMFFFSVRNNQRLY